MLETEKSEIETFIKGMDVSTLLEEEACGARYYDHGVEMDLFDILQSYGVNSVRLRLWNDPYDEDGTPYGAGTNDLEKTIALAKRAKSHGMTWLLDFHYSDFWADPGKQIVPKAWRGLDVAGLEKAVYDYTVEVMRRLGQEGVPPDLVQVGNELTNGLLWPTGKKPEYDNLARYINAGIRGVRAVDGRIPIMIHLDNGGFNEMYVDWFEHFMERGEPFDIIGLSYYPFWHGTMDQLEFNLRDMARRYGKRLVIAEVSMGFTMEDYRDRERNRSGKSADGPASGSDADELKGMATRPELVEKLEYPMSIQGQADFMRDIMERIKAVPGGAGFYYWEPAWIPVPGCGWANEAALLYTGEKGPGGNEWANQALFDYDGNALPALEVIRDF